MTGFSCSQFTLLPSFILCISPVSTSFCIMSCGTFDMQRSGSADTRHDVVLRGIFIHPDHISAGFCADEASYSSSSESASTISYEDEGSASELSEAALESLALEGDAQDATQDYFAPRAARSTAPMSSGASPMASDSTMSSAWCPSPTSTAATTPTNLSASPSKGMPLTRRPSQMANFGLVSPGLPATFSFAAFGATDADSDAGTPRPALPRAPSPSRCHPYTRVKSSGTAMQRSVSTPVETQRQVEERERRLSAAEDAMDTRAVKMARSKSGASTPSGARTPAEPCFATATASAPMTRRSSGALVSPLSEVFGPDWGKTLPPAPPLDASKPLTFPDNVARPPLSPLRNARSRSFAGLEQAYEPMSLDATPEAAFSASMASGPRALRPRSRLSVSFGPLTPILPDSNVAVRADESDADVLSSPVRNRLYRGMSF